LVREAGALPGSPIANLSDCPGDWNGSQKRAPKKGVSIERVPNDQACSEDNRAPPV